ncbi:MAG: non-heme iron oxygenase ferredoxin subunit [Anaerolineales bacterium]|jgi:3-phenylpropionate/trans-cinnamate dioxygenase ferredoxin subunit|nr:non-heme iron oxygenase ferredoxin subunit [Anaerolineales bacterium]
MYNYSQYNEDQCEFVDVAAANELPRGGRFFVEIDDLPIVVFNIGGQIFAIGDVCTHDDGPLGDGELTGFEISCPRHGASFDVRSGKVISLPAIVDIPAYPVRIVDGQIQIGLPK